MISILFMACAQAPTPCTRDEQCAGLGVEYVCAPDQGWCELGPEIAVTDTGLPPLEPPSLPTDIPLAALVFSEVMLNPSDGVAWFELHNTFSNPIVPRLLQIGTLGGDVRSFKLTGTEPIEPDAYYVVASAPFKSAGNEQGPVADELWPAGFHPNDGLYLLARSGLASVIVWMGENWEDAKNVSMQLSPNAQPDAAADPGQWSEAPCGQRYNGTDCGSPGRENLQPDRNR